MKMTFSGRGRALGREALAHETLRYLAARPINGDVVGCQRGHVGIRHHRDATARAKRAARP